MLANHLRQLVVRKMDGCKRGSRSEGAGKGVESVASKEESLKPDGILNFLAKMFKIVLKKPLMAKEGWERGEAVVPQVEISENTKLGKKIHWKLQNLVVLKI